MSQMEHNKGKLIPTGKRFQILTDEDEEYLSNNDLVVFDSKEYKVEWEIQRGELYGFADVVVNPDNTINFNTYHYNSGHWTDVVEGALNES